MNYNGVLSPGASFKLILNMKIEIRGTPSPSCFNYNYNQDLGRFKNVCLLFLKFLLDIFEISEKKEGLGSTSPEYIKI